MRMVSTTERNGQGISFICGGDEEDGENREGQRKAQTDARAFAQLAINFDGAIELFHVGANDVHAHAAAGNVTDFFREAEAGEEDEVENFAGAHGGELFLGDEAFLDGFFGDAVVVHACAVIFDLDDDVVAFLASFDADRAARRLAALDARGRQFDAVIERIAKEVNERIDDLLGDGFVQLGIFSVDDQLDFLAEGAGEIANHARKAAENGFDGNHASAQAGGLQLVGDEAEARGGLEKRGFEAIVGELALGKAAAEMQEAIAFEDEFADEIDEFIELGDIHADGARGFGGGGGRL